METPIQKTGTTTLAVPAKSTEFWEDPSWGWEDVADELLEATARGFVHWLQAAAQLSRCFPYDSFESLRLRYARKLIEIHGLDPRVERVFNTNVRVLFTTGGWVDADTLQPQKIVRRTIECLAAVQDPVLEKSGWTLKPNACLVERAMSGAGWKVSKARYPCALRLVIMPHVTRAVIDDFVPALENVCR